MAFSHYNNITAQLPIDPVSGQLVVGGVAEQAAQCLKNIKAVLTSIDVPFDDIVKVNVFLTDLADVDAVNEVYKRFFPDSGIARAVAYMPARTVVPVAALPMHAKVQIEAVCSHGDGTPPQAVEDRHGLIIEANNTDAAPRCPLSTQTVAFSHYNNITGQLPIDPATGKMVEGGVAEQARQILSNIKAIIECVDHSLADTRQGEHLRPRPGRHGGHRRGLRRVLPGCVPARRVGRRLRAADGCPRHDGRHLRQLRGHSADCVSPAERQPWPEASAYG